MQHVELSLHFIIIYVILNSKILLICNLNNVSELTESITEWQEIAAIEKGVFVSLNHIYVCR